MMPKRGIPRYCKFVSATAQVDSALTVVPTRVQIAYEHGKLLT
jgi:hypothetical protein